MPARPLAPVHNASHQLDSPVDSLSHAERIARAQLTLATLQKAFGGFRMTNNDSGRIILEPSTVTTCDDQTLGRFVRCQPGKDGSQQFEPSLTVGDIARI